MSYVNDVERDVERLSSLLVPYICERTGLSHDDVVKVMEAQDTFWTEQPHVVGHMVILGFSADELLSEGEDDA